MTIAVGARVRPYYNRFAHSQDSVTVLRIIAPPQILVVEPFDEELERLVPAK
jgi:hypothetical protein